MIGRLRNMAPVPMAAPETRALRDARMLILACLTLLMAMVGAWRVLHAAFGIVAVGAVVGVLSTLLVQVPIYVAVKRSADDAWLLRDRDDG